MAKGGRSGGLGAGRGFAGRKGPQGASRAAQSERRSAEGPASSRAGQGQERRSGHGDRRRTAGPIPPRGESQRSNDSQSATAAREPQGGAFKLNIKPGTRLIIGAHTVEKVLEHHPERLLTVLAQEGSSHLARLRGTIPAAVRVETVSAGQLARFSNSDSHQGIAAVVRDDGLVTIEDLLEQVAEEPRVMLLLLDGIEDPQNLGSIFRVAECFGVAGIILGRSKGSPLTPVASKASVGASEILPRAEVANLHRELTNLKNNGFWLVATSTKEGAVSLPKQPLPDRVVFLLGSEGRGLSPLLERESDLRVTIPLFGSVESLNVTQATTVFCYEWARSS